MLVQFSLEPVYSITFWKNFQIFSAFLLMVTLPTKNSPLCFYHCPSDRGKLLIPQEAFTAWKVSKYGDFSGPYFPVFGPEKTPYLDTFHAVFFWKHVSSKTGDRWRKQWFVLPKSNQKMTWMWLGTLGYLYFVWFVIFSNVMAVHFCK